MAKEPPDIRLSRGEMSPAASYMVVASSRLASAQSVGTMPALLTDRAVWREEKASPAAGTIDGTIDASQKAQSAGIKGEGQVSGSPGLKFFGKKCNFMQDKAINVGLALARMRLESTCGELNFFDKVAARAGCKLVD